MTVGGAPKLVVVLALAACLSAACSSDGGSGKDTTAASGPTTTEEARVLPPSDFAAEAADFSVALTWTPPPGDVERYALYRDGFALMSVAGTETTFTDEDVLPGEQHTYEIESRVGKTASDRISVAATTVVPPVKAARLEGTFNVRTRFVSKTGYGDYTKPNFGWQFKPRCEEGPCNVVWSDLQTTRIRANLQRHGGRYRGEYTGRFTIECSGTPSTSSVTIALRVDRAGVVDGEWRATRLLGTIDQSEVAQLGCRSAEARLAVRARLAR